MKMPHNANRKKIRGWKRRIEQVEKWGLSIQQPYLQSFKKAGDFTHERCYLYPFYALQKRQPPLWFFKLIVKQFFTAFDKWEKAFDRLDIPYDLQLWIYDPNFMWSEIICRVVEKKGDHAGYWSFAQQTVNVFPSKKFLNNAALSNDLEWVSAPEETEIFETELEDHCTTREELLAEGYVKYETEKYGSVYVKKIGEVWVGRRKDKKMAS